MTRDPRLLGSRVWRGAVATIAAASTTAAALGACTGNVSVGTLGEASTEPSSSDGGAVACPPAECGATPVVECGPGLQAEPACARGRDNGCTWSVRCIANVVPCTETDCGGTAPTDPCDPPSISKAECTRTPEGKCEWSTRCEAPAVGPYAWYRSCGFPVCSGPPEPATIPGCSAPGSVCSTVGDVCGKGDDTTCGVRMVCAVSDPRQSPGGCPISSRAFKTDVNYISEAAQQRLRAELLNTRLASHEYKPGLSQPDRQRFDFILEDHPAHSPAVDVRLRDVDLYGYVSMSVATLQIQDAELRTLREEVAQLKKSARATDHRRTPPPLRK